ncbi:hypothetical protein OIE66_11505 [Nonomuraea sp. NBC_01738]|uniref:hypothetical protein n=1 Tax=Nonomuraea sp. NBC_01738 TaxID=2976003 RepID=UPI002E0F97DB|nr:hypothetical protein OIE66_11505 [Nonomuraea sp. NBC_01738]
MNGRDILMTRLDTLLEDLEKVKEAIASTADKRKHIAAALDSLHAARVESRAILYTAMVVEAELETRDKGELGAIKNEMLMTGITNLPRHANKVFAEIENVMELLEPVRDRIIAAAIDSQHALQSALETDCAELIGAAEDLRDKLVAGDPLAPLWTEYLEFVDNRARPVFDAYVDFISGLAVRDSDLDGSICAISDHLMTRLLGQHEALSLPAREAALSMHAIIKLGFPEWGIWSVPLAAREAGASLVRHAKARKLVRVLATPPEGLAVEEAERLAEDAVGAFMLGPAYARAMFTFRLRPGWPAQPGMPDDRLRAQIILAILRMQGDEDRQDDFSDEVAKLSALWKNALTDLCTEPGPELDEAFVKGVHTALRSERMRDFSTANWSHVTEWASHLLNRRGSDTPAPLIEADRVVTLLNAGWLARRMAPELADDIADSLMELIKQNGGSMASSPRNVRPSIAQTPPRGAR